MKWKIQFSNNKIIIADSNGKKRTLKDFLTFIINDRYGKNISKLTIERNTKAFHNSNPYLVKFLYNKEEISFFIIYEKVKCIKSFNQFCGSLQNSLKSADKKIAKSEIVYNVDFDGFNISVVEKDDIVNQLIMKMEEYDEKLEDISDLARFYTIEQKTKTEF